MKKQVLAIAVAILATGSAFAQANDTIAKVKASGSVTMGVRDSSGALSYTLGDGKYTGYHYEVCQHILSNLEKAVGKKQLVQPAAAFNRCLVPTVKHQQAVKQVVKNIASGYQNHTDHSAHCSCYSDKIRR